MKWKIAEMAGTKPSDSEEVDVDPHTAWDGRRQEKLLQEEVCGQFFRPPWRAGFPSLGPTDILDHVILCCGGLSFALWDFQQHP